MSTTECTETELAQLAEELIDFGYRELAAQLHPDHGGSKEAMIRLNAVRDEFKKEIAKGRLYEHYRNHRSTS
jgi:hypothetical protein